MPEPTGPPDSARRAKELNADQLTVKITNSFGFDLPISYNSNAGSPTIIGNPGAGIFTRAQSTAVAVPRGFAGESTTLLQPTPISSLLSSHADSLC